MWHKWQYLRTNTPEYRNQSLLAVILWWRVSAAHSPVFLGLPKRYFHTVANLFVSVSFCSPGLCHHLDCSFCSPSTASMLITLQIHWLCSDSVLNSAAAAMCSPVLTHWGSDLCWFTSHMGATLCLMVGWGTGHRLCGFWMTTEANYVLYCFTALEELSHSSSNTLIYWRPVFCSQPTGSGLSFPKWLLSQASLSPIQIWQNFLPVINYLNPICKSSHIAVEL